MTSRFIDWIWHVRGSLALAPGQSVDDAFERLRPLFRQTGTSHEEAQDTLTFRKKDQAAQDRMAVFDGGVLRIERGGAGSVLHYRLTSRALLACFLAPLLFLGFGQLTIALGKLEAPTEEARSGKDAAKKDKKDEAARPMNSIDKFLGAPEPEKPEKDEAKKKQKAKEAQEKKHSPTSAYVFAGIFAALYVVGRVLEDRQVKSLFRRSLSGV